MKRMVFWVVFWGVAFFCVPLMTEKSIFEHLSLLMFGSSVEDVVDDSVVLMRSRDVVNSLDEQLVLLNRELAAEEALAAREALLLPPNPVAAEVVGFVVAVRAAQKADPTLGPLALFDIASLSDGLSLGFPDGINHLGRPVYLTGDSRWDIHPLTLHYGLDMDDVKYCLDLARVVGAKLSRDTTCSGGGLSVSVIGKKGSVKKQLVMNSADEQLVLLNRALAVEEALAAREALLLPPNP